MPYSVRIHGLWRCCSTSSWVGRIFQPLKYLPLLFKVSLLVAKWAQILNTEELPFHILSNYIGVHLVLAVLGVPCYQKEHFDFITHEQIWQASHSRLGGHCCAGYCGCRTLEQACGDLFSTPWATSASKRWWNWHFLTNVWGIGSIWTCLRWVKPARKVDVDQLTHQYVHVVPAALVCPCCTYGSNKHQQLNWMSILAHVTHSVTMSEQCLVQTVKVRVTSNITVFCMDFYITLPNLFLFIK